MPVFCYDSRLHYISIFPQALLYFIVLFYVFAFAVPLVVFPHANVVRAIFIKLPSISILLSLEKLTLIDIIIFGDLSCYALFVFGPFLELACWNVFSFCVFDLLEFDCCVTKFNLQVRVPDDVVKREWIELLPTFKCLLRLLRIEFRCRVK